MTERRTELNLDYSMLPIADPHARIAPDRKLVVLSTNPSTLKLFDAEKMRETRIAEHQAAAIREGVIRNQRIAEMDVRRETPVRREIAA